MIRCKIRPSARLRYSASDPGSTVTFADLPDVDVDLPAVPHIGDDLELPDGSERVVHSVAFTANDPVVLVFVE